MRALAAAGVMVMAFAGLATGASPAAAAGSVDPATLLPPPPPGAECRSVGAGVVCHTTFDASHENEPAFELPCGLLFESAQDVRRGIRWYVDGSLTRRAVFQNASGSWSLSPTGAGPSVTWVAHANWSNRDVDASAPEETWPTTFHGVSLRVSGPHGSPLFLFAGLERPDGSHSGVGDWADFESAEVQDALCSALTG